MDDMSDLSRALAQIDAIHEQVARSATYRGWRPVPVAASGVVGLAAAAWQSGGAASTDGVNFALFWTAVAAMAATVGCAEILWHFSARSTPAERRQTRHVLCHLLPALVAGALATAALVQRVPALATLLPGLWSVLFGVGIFGARPLLPRGSAVVAFYFWVVGSALLWSGVDATTPSAWAVGGTFGVGQMLAAAILAADRQGKGQRAEGKGNEQD
jgi:hypothetical protein